MQLASKVIVCPLRKYFMSFYTRNCHKHWSPKILILEIVKCNTETSCLLRENMKKKLTNYVIFVSPISMLYFCYVYQLDLFGVFSMESFSWTTTICMHSFSQNLWNALALFMRGDIIHRPWKKMLTVLPKNENRTLFWNKSFTLCYLSYLVLYYNKHCLQCNNL